MKLIYTILLFVIAASNVCARTDILSVSPDTLRPNSIIVLTVAGEPCTYGNPPYFESRTDNDIRFDSNISLCVPFPNFPREIFTFNIGPLPPGTYTISFFTGPFLADTVQIQVVPYSIPSLNIYGSLCLMILLFLLVFITKDKYTPQSRHFW